MGRPRTGSTRLKRGKWEAWLAGEYLGSEDTQQEAQDLVDAALASDDGLGSDTLSVFGAGWIERRELDARARGRGRAGMTELSRWKTHVESAPFFEKKLRSITPKMVQQWVRAMQQKQAISALHTGPVGKKVVKREKRSRSLARRTIANTLNLLALCFDDAVVDGLMQNNPARMVKISRSAPKKRDGELVIHLTELEIDQLFSMELPSRERAFFALAVFGGLRLGELLGLRWGDVDQRRIMIRRSYDGPVKADKSLRDVPALPPVVEAVRSYRQSLEAPPIGGLMFPSDTGGCHGPSYTCAWTDKLYRKGGKLRSRIGWASKAGIKGKTFHSLRHTCGCHLLMGTWAKWTGPIEMHDVSRWLGHSSIAVTETHYAQLSKDALTNRVQRVLRAMERKKENEV